MHSPTADEDRTNVVRKRRRRGKPRFTTVMRCVVLITAIAFVTAFVLWLKRETPHPSAAIASRASPLVEARSLKSPLATAQSSALAAYGMKKESLPALVAGPVQPQPVEAATVSKMLPVWLMADAPEFAGAEHGGASRAQTTERLRQSLRESGARQMGTTVRFAMLNVAELLAMEPKTWTASLATQAASENRASAMLLTFYLYYLDRAGDAAGVKALLRAMEQGLPEDRAVRGFILAGRSTVELEREMGLAFAAAGVELQFTRRGGAVFKP